MDSDLVDAVEGLKAIFQKRKIEATFGKAPAELVDALKKQLRIPARVRNFYLAPTRSASRRLPLSSGSA